MSANLWLVLSTAVFFGLATGIYEYVLPLYLKSQGITFAEMGAIFAIAGAVMVAVRIYLGGLTDRVGRKPMLGTALALCGLATAAPPLFVNLLAQAALKIARDIAMLTRETVFPIVLYEEQRGAFLNFIGKFRGIEFLLQAGGTLLAGAIVSTVGLVNVLGYRVGLYVAGGALCVAALLWSVAFREHRSAPPPQALNLRALFNLDLHHNLRVMLAASLVLTLGVQLSHSFYLPIFFKERFGIPDQTNALLMGLHRVTIALPMLVVGNLRLKNLRAWYIWGFLIEGVTLALCAVLPNFWASAGVFLLHDLIGAGIWSPIQAMLIQKFSRDATRGTEVGKVLAWTSLGAVAAPLIAGHLAERHVILPFLVSGLVTLVAAIPLCWLKPELPAPDAVRAAGAVVAA